MDVRFYALRRVTALVLIAIVRHHDIGNSSS